MQIASIRSKTAGQVHAGSGRWFSLTDLNHTDDGSFIFANFKKNC